MSFKCEIEMTIILSKKEAKKFKHSVVYGIAEKTNPENIIYVGKTLNLSKRSQAHIWNGGKGNSQLKTWFAKNDFVFVILSFEPKDINKTEKFFINKYKNQIFNLICGGEQTWRKHEAKPWNAKTGIQCPSSYLSNHLIRNNKDSYIINKVNKSLELRNKMNDFQRCSYEIDIFNWLKNNQSFNFKRLEKWASYSLQKCIQKIEGIYAS